MSDETSNRPGIPSDDSPSPDSDFDSSAESVSSQIPAAPVTDEPTVISNRPPVHAVHRGGALGARELGQTLAGRRLAHFQLEEFVGGGGMGAVFRATDTMLNRTVAVKVLSRDQGRDEETVKRFQNEAQSAARLDHDNIARVYFVGEDDGWYFIVFEFIEGRNLRELVSDQGPMQLDRALQVTLQIAEAIDHAARREVVHRDIKPSNVLLTPAGKAKLVDMGLARLRPLQPDDEDLTASGVTLGTFDYISPEQAKDPRTADVRSDLYSLGCTLYFMLTGQPPFPEGTVLQKLLSHSSDAAPDPRRLRPELPAELVPLIDKMLAKQPSDRYTRPIDLIGDLLLLSERLGIFTTAQPLAYWVSPKPTRWDRLCQQLPWSVPVSIFILLVIFWDPAWLDGSSTNSIEPRFEIPTSARLPAPVPEAPNAALSAPVLTPILSEDSPSKTASADSQLDRETPENGASADVHEPGASDSDRVPLTGEEPTEPSGLSDEDPPSVPRPDVVSDASRTLVVDSSPGSPPITGQQVVADLAGAFQLSQQNPAIDTIRLRLNGRVEMPPVALRLEGRSLKLVAESGFAPVLSFRTGTTVSEFAHGGMIRVLGGKLVIEGIHLEMIVPNETLGGEWCLFQLEQASSVQFDNGSIAIHNSYGGRFSNLDNVAVFNCFLPDRNEMFVPDPGEPREPVTIDLKNCVIWCEATVLHAQESLPIRFSWTNGLLVTSERLASMGGATHPPRAGERAELTLKQLTAITDQGLAELSSSVNLPFLMPVIIESESSIWSTQRLSPLISQNGTNRLAEFMAQIEYRGDRNAYEGIVSFWKIDPWDKSESKNFDFEVWRTHWHEVRRYWDPVPWRYPFDRSRPIHDYRISDFGLQSSDPTADPTAPDLKTELTLGFRSIDLPRPPSPDHSQPSKTRPYFQF